jgi:hypothetical protein
MPLPAGASYYAEFVTSNPTTGAAQNGDSLPTATATKNGADDGTFTLTVTNLDTGRYKITGTVPGGYAAGDSVQVSVAATVATVAGKAVVDNFQVGVPNSNALAIDASGRVDVGKILGTASQGAAGYVGIDWGHINAPTTTVNLSGTTIAAVAGAVGSVTATVTVGAYAAGQDPISKLAVRTGTAQAGTASSLTLDSGASATNSVYNGLALYLTGGTGAGQVRTIVGYSGTTKVATLDRAFQVTPNNTTTFALMPADSPTLNASLQVSANVATATIRTGTAQAGSANAITLDAGASTINNIYSGDQITLTGGTGVGQTRSIVSYNGTTKAATIAPGWTTIPDNTSTFAVSANLTPSAYSTQGVATAASASTITLDATASGTSGVYVGSVLTILSGTDAGDTVQVTSYNGSTRVATVSPNFAVTPDTTSAYAVIPTQAQAPTASLVTANVLQWAGQAVQTDANGLPIVDAQAGGITLGGTLTAPRALDALADGSITVNDALWAAVCAAAGKEQVSGTTYTVRTPSTGTTIRTFTLDSGSAPSTRS